MLTNYKPSNSSLGNRVKSLIETDIIKAIDQIDAFENNSDFISSSEFEINKKIIKTSSLYITKLEEIAEASDESGTYIYR